eukprot:s466_g11.t1
MAFAKAERFPSEACVSPGPGAYDPRVPSGGWSRGYTFAPPKEALQRSNQKYQNQRLHVSNAGHGLRALLTKKSHSSMARQQAHVRAELLTTRVSRLQLLEELGRGGLARLFRTHWQGGEAAAKLRDDRDHLEPGQEERDQA